MKKQFMDYDINLLVQQLPLQQLSDKGGYYQSLCPYHQDKNPSFSIVKGLGSRADTKGLCKCWSCGVTINIYTLTKDLTGQNMYDLLGIKRDYNSALFLNNLENQYLDESNKEDNDYYINNKNEVTIEGDLIDVHENNRLLDYLYNKRHIGNDFINTFGLKYMKKGKINDTWIIDRLVIPIYENGKMVSAECRTYYESEYKKVIYPKNSSVNCLFNWNNINPNELVYGTEGIMGLSSVWQWVSKNVVSTFGKILTRYQKKLINILPNFCTIPDNDMDKDPPVDNIKLTLDTYDEFYHTEYQIAEIKEIGKDPNDFNREELLSICNNKKSSTEVLFDRYGILKQESSKIKYQW